MVVCARCGREPRADESVIFLSFEARLLHVTCYEAESAKVIAHAHDVVNESTLRNKSSRELLARAELGLVESAVACAMAREAVKDSRHLRGGDETCLSCNVGAFLGVRNRHDLDGLMGLMSDHCIVDVIGLGPLPAGRYEGGDAVRGAYEVLFETFPDARWTETAYAIATNTASCEWTFQATRADGTMLASTGHDVLKFSEGRIAVQTSRVSPVPQRWSGNGPMRY